MKLQVAFSALLAVLLVTILRVEAAPLKRRGNGLVTLPLKRVQVRHSNVHPLVRLQQHVNRGSRRIARMTGREEPSHEELRSFIEKRLIALDEWDVLEKRYNRQGTSTDGITGLKLVGPALKAIGVTGSLNNAGVAIKNNNQVGNGTVQKSSQVASGAITDGAAQNATQVATGTKSGDRIGAGSTKNGNRVSAGGNNQNQNGQRITGAQAGQATAPQSQQPAAGSNQTAANPGVSQVKINAAAQGGVTQANTPAAGNSIGLDIEANDVGYLATVTMGTPPKNFLLLMDSGSADLWVGAENCQSQAGGGCGNHNFLGPQSSNTFKDSQQTFAITYGTGQVQGDIVTDNINVAGLALTGHKFGVATTESVEFSDNSTPFDGIMGLAKSALSEQKTLTPVEALATNGLVKSAITSYKISRVEDQLNDGEVTFGGTDPTKFDPNTVVTLPTVSQLGFWEAAMGAVTVNGKDVGLQGRTAILDTGTTLIIAPAADALAVHQQIPGAQSDGQGGFVIPCTTTASVALTFGGRSFAIDPRDLAFAPLDPANPAGNCASGISSGNIGGATEWLVGDVFLKNAYFSTDATKNQLSLAKLK